MRSSSQRLLLNCSRQSGKSTIASVLALHRALYFAPSLILLLSPSLRQSSELFRKVLDRLAAIPEAPDRTEDNRLSLAFANGSRIVSLPSSEGTVRGFSGVALIVEDEAGWVPDDLHAAVRPMVAVSGGKMVLMSTPNGRRGHFFLEWSAPESTWEKIRIAATDVPRIPAHFLAEERRSLGDWRYRQEYCGEFVESDSQLFRHEDVMAALSPDVQPLIVRSAHG
ncbi:MAG TPA: terminase family protein [Polyangiaceae bacterium]